VHHDAGLVIGGAATEEPSFSFGGLEGRTPPQVSLACWLDVMVGVEEQGGLSRGATVVPVHIRMSPRYLEEPYVFEAPAAQEVGDGVCAVPNLSGREALEGDARDSDQRLEVVHALGCISRALLQCFCDIRMAQFGLLVGDRAMALRRPP
jgi:hypothetical protein